MRYWIVPLVVVALQLAGVAFVVWIVLQVLDIARKAVS